MVVVGTWLGMFSSGFEYKDHQCTINSDCFEANVIVVHPTAEKYLAKKVKSFT